MHRRKPSKHMPLESPSDGNHVGAAGGRGSLPPVMVVGIGASSGGLAPLQAILSGLSGGQGLAVVIVQHMGAQSDGLLASLISGQTPLQVVEAADGMLIGADHVYIVSPDRMLSVTDGRLSVQDVSQCQGLRMPIDHCFCTLAADAGRRAAGVVLSGIGMDGTAGLAEIKSLGGLAVAQDPATAEFPEMPGNAVTAGHPDAVLSPEAITAFLVQRAEELIAMTARQQEEAALEEVLAAVRNFTGHDFHCYKRGTLERRVHRRMALHRCGSYDEYSRLLRTNREEAAAMRKDLLIGVTEFFRQVEAWRVLNEKVLFELVAAAKPQATLRVWVPACASGKEVYSLAMLLAETIEASGKKLSLQIFATDVDAGAVEQARAGLYSEDDLRGVSQTRLGRFFVRKNGRYEVIKQLRETIVFAPQDLTSDPPFSRLDLVSCRNLLIYLDQSVQKKIIQLFHFALREGGYLFLGSAENINGQENLFEPVSQKWRIYRKLGMTTPVSLDLPLRPSAKPVATIPAAVQPRQTLSGITNQVIAEAFGPPAAVVVDRKGTLLYMHGDVGDYLKFTAGEHTGLLADAAREGLPNRLASAILRAVSENRQTTVQARVKKGRKTSVVKITVQPLRHPREAEGLLLVSFEPQRLTKAARAAAEGNIPQSDARQLEDELLITREELSSTIKQLEQSNEHLKALNEEVMSANEELQSANEELETSKEELHSLNEELNAVNQRLQEKVAELEQSGNDVANLLTSGNVATVFLDRKLCIRRFTPAVTKLLSVIDSDIGRPITDIVRKFKDERLLDDARRVLVDLAPAGAEVRVDDGGWYLRRILPYRTKDERIEGVVVTFSDVTDLKELAEALRFSEEEARESERRYRELVQNANSAIIRWNCDGTITFFNEYAQSFFGYSAEEVIGKHANMLLPSRDSAGVDLTTLVEDIATRPDRYVNNVNENICKDGSRVWMAWTNRPIYDAGGQVAGILAVGMDITERKKAEDALQEREREFAATFERSVVGKSLADPATHRMLHVNQAFADMLGYSIEELCGKTFVEITHPEDRERDLAVYDAARTGKTDKWEIEKRYLRKDGSIMWAHVSGNFIYYDDDRPARSIAVIQDITARKQAEEALRRSEARWNAAIENFAEGVIIATEDEQVIYWNPAARGMHGFSRPDEFIEPLERTPITFQLWTPDGSHLLELDEWPMRRIKRGETLRNLELRIRRPDQGWEKIFSYSGAMVDTAGGERLIFLTCHDLTGLRQAEQALRESDARFRLALRNAPVSVAVQDRDLRYIWAYNQRSARRDQIIGHTDHEIFTPEEAEHITTLKRRVLDEGIELREQMWLDRPLGRMYLDILWEPVRDKAGNITGVASATVDLTPIKLAEEATRESEEQFRRAIEDAPIPVIMHAEDGQVLQISKTWTELTGYASDDIPSFEAWLNRAYGEGADAVRNHMRRLFKGGSRIINIEFPVRTHEGKQRYWSFSASAPGKLADGRHYVVGMAVDITERKRAEEDIRGLSASLAARNAELEAVNKDLESFIYSISHDLRAPVRHMTGFAGILLEDYEDRLDEQGKDYLMRIRTGADKMTRLIDDLLRLSRISRQEMVWTKIDLSALAQTVIAELKEPVPGRRITVFVAEGIAAFADKGLMEIALANLLENAWKFTAKTEEARIEFGVMTQGSGKPVYYVRDNGAGFDPQHQNKMFRPFQRLHSEKEFAGTGIGLAIVERIIHRHGGRIWAEGEVGKGAAVYFTLK